MTNEALEGERRGDRPTPEAAAAALRRSKRTITEILRVDAEMGRRIA